MCSGPERLGNLPIVTLKSMNTKLSNGLCCPHMCLLSCLWTLTFASRWNALAFFNYAILLLENSYCEFRDIVVEVWRLPKGTERFSKQLFPWVFIWGGSSPSGSRYMSSLSDVLGTDLDMGIKWGGELLPCPGSLYETRRQRVKQAKCGPSQFSKSLSCAEKQWLKIS